MVKSKYPLFLIIQKLTKVNVTISNCQTPYFAKSGKALDTSLYGFVDDIILSDIFGTGPI